MTKKLNITQSDYNFLSNLCPTQEKNERKTKFQSRNLIFQQRFPLNSDQNKLISIEEDPQVKPNQNQLQNVIEKQISKLKDVVIPSLIQNMHVKKPKKFKTNNFGFQYQTISKNPQKSLLETCQKQINTINNVKKQPKRSQKRKKIQKVTKKVIKNKQVKRKPSQNKKNSKYYLDSLSQKMFLTIQDIFK